MSPPWHPPARRSHASRKRGPQQLQAELQRRRLRREIRRGELVADALDALGDDADHTAVAALTGLPVGYLRWAHPQLGDACR